jgi:hypothetical protein
MIADSRQPSYGRDGQQISWTLGVMDVVGRGLLPRNPQECPRFRADGQHHVCLHENGDDYCPSMVSWTDGTRVVCVHEFPLEVPEP